SYATCVLTKCPLCGLIEFAARFLHEVDGHLGSGIGHLDGETVDAVLEVVVRPHRGNRDEETERRRDESFRNTGRNRSDTAARRGHLSEGVDDADDRSEETDERRGRTDRCENA